MPALPAAGRPVLVRVATDGTRVVARQQMRAVLREILAHWSGLAAEALPIAETERGPVWRGELAGESLDISLSYTAGEGWLALCRGAAVGVDAMVTCTFAEMADVARLYLGPEVADRLVKAADPDEAFARAWTAREAQLKCFKCGLTEWSPREILPPVEWSSVALEDAHGLVVALATGYHPASHHGRLLAALEIGERDIAAGRTVPYTPDLLKKIEQEARIHAANNRPTNSDVTP